MTGSGIGFVLHENGWLCSNEVYFDVEKDLTINEKGEKISKRIQKLKFNCIFEEGDSLGNDIPVYCIYKDEDGEQHAFAGLTIKINSERLHILIKGTSDKLIDIKNKIKTWQHKLTY